MCLDRLAHVAEHFGRARYTIQSTETGWEVREEEDAEILRRTHHQDWHRVERARLTITLKMDALRGEGWQEA